MLRHVICSSKHYTVALLCRDCIISKKHKERGLRRKQSPCKLCGTKIYFHLQKRHFLFVYDFQNEN